MNRIAPLAILLMVCFPSEAPGFVRGDVDSDGVVALPDVLHALKYLFVMGSPEPRCLDAMDLNDDGDLGLIDPLYLANFLYVGGAPPLPPYPDDGPDPTPDGLGDCAPGIALPFEVLAEGEDSNFVGASDPDFCPVDPVFFTFVVRDAVAWQSFWDQHTGPFSSPPLPFVDFTQHHVIVVIASVNSSGYDVSVTEVVEFPDRVEVRADVVDPQGCATLPVCSQPFELLQVPVIQTSGEVRMIPTPEFPCP